MTQARRAFRIPFRSMVLAASLTVLCSMASGYYNLVYFTSRNAPFQPIPARFDLNALPGNTVSYFISDQPPAAMMPGDSYAGIVSQIRSAAAVWNGVASSALRLSYGGVSPIGAVQSTPGIDVVFDDNMPPGLLAQTRVTTPDEVTPYVGGGFVPLLRSRVQLRSDLTALKQSSFSELFYTTLVHEFGHSLGLQHSLVSGAMATSVTRATTKGHPLSADDVAAVSLLYPAAGFVASTGSITGRVTFGANGGGANGVNLASVVALSANGVAISAMTNPDGTYRIDGIPVLTVNGLSAPGQYYVYVHPLPPAQQGEAYPDNVVPPVDVQKNPFPAATGFATQFFPGTRDWTQATQVAVNAGATVANVNFAVQASAGPAVYNLETYAYQGAGGQNPVPSPYLKSGSRLYLVFTANGALVNGTTQMTPGLSVSAIGSAASMEPASLAYYQQGFLYQIIDPGQVSAPVPVALAVTTPTDLYVLPAAVTVTPSAAPAVTSVNGSTDGIGNATVNLVGANLTGQTEVLFDGAAATQVQANSDGSLTVNAPPATGAYRAFVEAVNSDGQSSAQALGAAQPPVFAYAAPGNPSISVLGTGVLQAGTDALINITGVNTQFADGQAVLGLGSSDVQVRRTWVRPGNIVMADVSVSPQATPGTVTVSVADGLQLVTLPAVLQVQPANPQQISLRAPVVNAVTLLAGVPSGGTAMMGITGLPQNTTAQTLAGWTLTIGGVSARITSATPNQIQAQVPFNVTVGPAAVHLIPPSGDTIPQIAMQVDALPPDVQPTDLTHPVGVGDTVSLTVFSLAGDTALAVAPSSVVVLVNGVIQPTPTVTPLGAQDSYSVQFKLSGNVPIGQNDLVTVGIGTRQSAPVWLAVHN